MKVYVYSNDKSKIKLFTNEIKGIEHSQDLCPWRLLGTTEFPIEKMKKTVVKEHIGYSREHLKWALGLPGNAKNIKIIYEIDEVEE